VIDSLLLFGHVLGVVVLVAGIALEEYSITAAARAASVTELRQAVRPAHVLPTVMPLATLLMTGCGLALVAHDKAAFRFGDAWVVASIGIVVGISVLGGGFSGRPATRLLDAADAAPDGPLTPKLATLVRDPLLHATARSTGVVAIWAIWLMSVRPHAAGTLVSFAVATAAVAGAWTSALRRRSEGRDVGPPPAGVIPGPAQGPGPGTAMTRW
jgi:hypothetical protein